MRLADKEHPQHEVAERATVFYRPSRVLCIFPQNIYEFWVVATRPVKDNGLGYTRQETLDAIEMSEQYYKLIPDSPAIYPTWKELVAGQTVFGKIGHDARLVAGMQTAGITEILTFNDKDFRRFTGIAVVNPKDVIVLPAGT